jgi:hypothetical protein
VCKAESLFERRVRAGRVKVVHEFDGPSLGHYALLADHIVDDFT